MEANGTISIPQMASARSFGVRIWITGAVLVILMALSIINMPTAAAQTPDVSPPSLENFDFWPREIDTSDGPETITATLEITDEGSGVCVSICSDSSSPTQVRFEHAETGQFKDGLFNIASGTPGDGIYESSITFPKSSAGGIWNIKSMLLADDIGNRSWRTSAQLNSQGYPTELRNNSGLGSATSPATGGATSPSISPTQVPGDIDGTDGETSSDDSTGDIDQNDDQVSMTKSYTRFEVHQQARKALAGNLILKGEGVDQTVPYSASPNEQFSLSAQFKELTGHYELTMTQVGHEGPILRVDGELQNLGNGEYSHQFLNGDADPAFFVLASDSVGMAISLGSVKARLNSCITLFSPTDGIFELGVDSDGDGLIESSEIVTEALQGASEACVTTPLEDIPLTSLYDSTVATTGGTVLAQNRGLYDFLNKSSVESKKQAVPDMVREFKVQWLRSPVATSFEVKNMYLRPPADTRKVEPQETDEWTEDTISNDSDASGVMPGSGGNDPGASANSTPSGSGESSGFFLKNLLWIALGIGLIADAVAVMRGVIFPEPTAYPAR